MLVLYYLFFPKAFRSNAESKHIGNKFLFFNSLTDRVLRLLLITTWDYVTKWAYLRDNERNLYKS